MYGVRDRAQGDCEIEPAIMRTTLEFFNGMREAAESNSSREDIQT